MLQGAQREGPGPRAGGEERREGGAVEERDPVGEHRPGVARSALLPGTRVQLAQHGLVSARPERLPERVDRGEVAVQEFPEDGHAGEVPVDGAVGTEQLGEHGGGAPAVQVGDVPDQPLGQHTRGLVGVGGPSVQVEVVGGGRVADAHHHIERVVRAEFASGAADGEHRGPAGERLEREGLHDRPHQPGGLAAPGGPTASSEVPSSAGSRASPEPRRAYGLCGSSAQLPRRT